MIVEIITQSLETSRRMDVCEQQQQPNEMMNEIEL